MSLKDAMSLTRQLSRKYCRSRVVWRLREPSSLETLSDFLSLASIEVKPEALAEWTPMMRAMAEEWAAQVQLSASDVSHIRIPPKPNWLPEERPATFTPLPT